MPALLAAAAIYRGGAAVSAVYRGATLVWQPITGTGSFTVTWAFTGDSMAGVSSGGGVNAAAVTHTGLTSFAAASWPGYASVPVVTVVPQTDATGSAEPATLAGYIQLAAGPVGEWTPTSLAFDGGKGASSGTRGAVVRTSADGYAADVTHFDFTTTRPNFATYTADLTALGTITGQLGIRVYPYSSTAGGGLEFDNFVLYGTHV